MFYEQINKLFVVANKYVWKWEGKAKKIPGKIEKSWDSGFRISMHDV